MYFHHPQTSFSPKMGITRFRKGITFLSIPVTAPQHLIMHQENGPKARPEVFLAIFNFPVLALLPSSWWLSIFHRHQRQSHCLATFPNLSKSNWKLGTLFLPSFRYDCLTCFATSSDPQLWGSGLDHRFQRADDTRCWNCTSVQLHPQSNPYHLPRGCGCPTWL